MGRRERLQLEPSPPAQPADALAQAVGKQTLVVPLCVGPSPLLAASFRWRRFGLDRYHAKSAPHGPPPVSPYFCLIPRDPLGPRRFLVTETSGEHSSCREGTLMGDPQVQWASCRFRTLSGGSWPWSPRRSHHASPRFPGPDPKQEFPNASMFPTESDSQSNVSPPLLLPEHSFYSHGAGVGFQAC